MQFCVGRHIRRDGSRISCHHEIPAREGVMTRINRQTQRITAWLSRAIPADELTALSDRDLRDIGVVRYQPNMEACKPFWMA